MTRSLEKINGFKPKMMSRVKMFDLCLLRSYLGIQVKKDTNAIVLSQRSFSPKTLKELNMTESNSTLSPIEMKLKFIQNDKGSLIDSSYYINIMRSLRYLTHTTCYAVQCGVFKPIFGKANIQALEMGIKNLEVCQRHH